MTVRFEKVKVNKVAFKGPVDKGLKGATAQFEVDLASLKTDADKRDTHLKSADYIDTAKRATAVVAEALECHGGNGFIADHMMERLYREAPLNGIWEGTGNVICLDVLRAMVREPAAVGAFLAEVGQARGADPRLDAFAADLARRLQDPAGLEPVARQVVERMALALQGSLLLRHAPAVVSDAFCATRLDGDWGHAFGALPRGLDVRAIAARAGVG